MKEKLYFAVSLSGDDWFTIGRFDTLEEAIEAARAEWRQLSKADREKNRIEVREYQDDIESDDCQCFDYDTFEWKVLIPGMSDQQIKAIEKLYSELPFDPMHAHDDLDNDILTISTAKDGRDFVRYYDGRYSEALYIDTLQWLDHDEIEMQLK